MLFGLFVVSKLYLTWSAVNICKQAYHKNAFLKNKTCNILYVVNADAYVTMVILAQDIRGVMS